MKLCISVNLFLHCVEGNTVWKQDYDRAGTNNLLQENK
jgi:hypothetical protein